MLSCSNLMKYCVEENWFGLDANHFLRLCFIKMGIDCFQATQVLFPFLCLFLFSTYYLYLSCLLSSYHVLILNSYCVVFLNFTVPWTPACRERSRFITSQTRHSSDEPFLKWKFKSVSWYWGLTPVKAGRRDPGQLPEKSKLTDQAVTGTRNFKNDINITKKYI